MKNECLPRKQLYNSIIIFLFYKIQMIVKDHKKKLNKYFDNPAKRTNLVIVWNTSKAVKRDYFIQYTGNCLEKKKSQEKMQKILDEIRKKEIQFQKTPMDSKNVYQIKLLHQQFSVLTVPEIETKLN